jgi:hypothetical protein
MKTTSAFWRLFPTFLFTFLGLAWCFFWRFDPVLFAVAICIAALTSSWLLITIVEVAKTMIIAPVPSPKERVLASAGEGSAA